MPVYNAAPYLREAVDSILNQTFTDFEFLIFDDGSTDGSGEILEQYDDPRIILHHSPENVGYVRHLNAGLDVARGRYIFRMDADDIAFPQRFQKQYDFMEAHPETGLCGTWVERIGDKEGVAGDLTTHEEIVVYLLSGAVLYHPTIVLRSDILRKHQLYYDNRFLYAEDYDFFLRLSRVTRLAVLPEPLLYYRVHRKNVGNVHGDRQRELMDRFRVQRFEEILGRPLDAFEEKLVNHRLDFNARVDHGRINRFVQELLACNARDKAFDPAIFREGLLKQLFRNFHQQSEAGPFFFWNAWQLKRQWPELDRQMTRMLVNKTSKIFRRIKRRLHLSG